LDWERRDNGKTSGKMASLILKKLKRGREGKIRLDRRKLSK
jgi:hypothetical protein